MHPPCCMSSGSICASEQNVQLRESIVRKRTYKLFFAHLLSTSSSGVLTEWKPPINFAHSTSLHHSTRADSHLGVEDHATVWGWANRWGVGKVFKQIRLACFKAECAYLLRFLASILVQDQQVEWMYSWTNMTLPEIVGGFKCLRG